MAKLNKLNILSLAKLQAIMMAIIGLIVGILYSFGGAIYDIITVGLNIGTALAFFALIGMPIIFAFIGFILGFIMAFLYNLFARWFGGIEIDIQA